MALTVSALHVYPVKGLKGIDLAQARCTDRGLEHDRGWMVVDAHGEFLSQRSHPKMATVWTDLTADALLLAAPDMPELSVPLRPRGRSTRPVRVWRSTVEAIAADGGEADAWLSQLLGLDCSLVHMPEGSERFCNPDDAGPNKRVGFADGYSYLVVGEASLDELNRRLAARGHGALPMNRFRPNIVVAGGQAHAEDTWGEVRAGAARLRGVKPCGRCEVTTTDQATGERRGPEPLATLAEYRSSEEFGVMFGMNCVTVATGEVRVGDRIEPAVGKPGP